MAEAHEPLCERVGVVTITLLADAERDDRNDDALHLDAVDDAITLADGAYASKSGKLAHQRLALLVGFFGKRVDAPLNARPYAPIGDLSKQA